MANSKKPSDALPASQNGMIQIPGTWEYLLKKSAMDPKFREAFLERRGQLADELQIPISPQERTMLDSVPPSQLNLIIDRVHLTPEDRKGMSAGCLVSLLTGGLLLAIAVPNFKKARGHSIESPATCKMQIRELLGALETYNMDSPDMVDYVDERNRETLQSLLTTKKYIKSPPEEVFRCPGSATYYQLQNIIRSPRITCPFHGVLESDSYQFKK